MVQDILYCLEVSKDTVEQFKVQISFRYAPYLESVCKNRYYRVGLTRSAYNMTLLYAKNYVNVKYNMKFKGRVYNLFINYFEHMVVF